MQCWNTSEFYLVASLVIEWTPIPFDVITPKVLSVALTREIGWWVRKRMDFGGKFRL